MWCSQSLMFGHSMFGVFKVWHFDVRSKTNRNTSPCLDPKFQHIEVFCSANRIWFKTRYQRMVLESTSIPSKSYYYILYNNTNQSNNCSPFWKEYIWNWIKAHANANVCSWVFLAALLSLSFCRPGQRSIEVSSHQAKGQMEDGRSIFSRHTQENGDQKGVQCPQHNVVNDHLGRGVLFYISIAYQTLPATRE